VKKLIGPLLIALTLAAAGLIPLGAQGPSGGAAIPRTADGKPNLSGIWQTLGSAEVDLQAHHARKGLPAGVSVVEGNDIPYLPAALEQKKKNQAHPEDDPNTRCYYPGVPRLTYMPYPFQIVMMANRVAMLFEYNHAVRNVFTKDTKHPPDGLDFWLGDSRGHWEGDTFVIDTNNFNDKTWFDQAGNYHSSALHVIERLTMMDADHIAYRATIEDPRVFSRPWNINLVLYRRKEANMQVLEYECYTYDGHEFHMPDPAEYQ
jgi:hypothetical protein